MATEYPILLRRYLAALVDILVPLAIAGTIGKNLANSFELPIPVSALILVLPFILYEPLLTALYATVGQLLFMFRVRKLNETSKIGFGQAYIRVIVKYFLGWISLMTLPARTDRRAMHDLASGSIVVSASNSSRA